ncbi:LacI family DNA-binding transcriptional regulator [Cellulomonas citrea]|uniref:LacI family DNA-binding transcriptional regulator n=1 Tax=Cellulomonas citrea TaxID=1909423 RepID=UPI0013580B19|nr:LacI family DNA-binding transcriptional regulator [Cellulomonas citrea]
MATIRDVAADAGVAASTVSYVLSGNKKLPQATVDRVLASVARLGYRPSPAARALALGRTNILGMLAPLSADTPDADVDIFMRFVRAAMYAAQPRGYDVLVMGRGDDELRGDILADAIVVMDIRVVEARLPLLVDRGLSTVLIGIPDDRLGTTAVDLDFGHAARVMVQHLAAQGHGQLAVLAPPTERPGHELAYRRRFWNAFDAECDRLGVRGTFQPCAGTSDADVEQWLGQVHAVLPGVTGVLVLGVSSLPALDRALNARGLSVPGDLSVVSLAPQEQFETLYPAMTVVDLPGQAMVEWAVNRALDELAGALPGAVRLLPAVLHDRGSTGAPGRGLVGR